MQTVGEHVSEWLDEIGADGLMYPDAPNMPKNDILIKGHDLEAFMNATHLIDPRRVPAFRHADGTYHAEPDLKKPCDECKRENCLHDFAERDCPAYILWHKRWLAHKETT